MGTWARPVPSPGQIHADGLILRPLLREHQGDRPGLVATEQRSLREGHSLSNLATLLIEQALEVLPARNR
jgi:hypothetical protein